MVVCHLLLRRITACSGQTALTLIICLLLALQSNQRQASTRTSDATATVAADGPAEEGAPGIHRRAVAANFDVFAVLMLRLAASAPVASRNVAFLRI